MTTKNQSRITFDEVLRDEAEYSIDLPASEVYASLVEYFSRMTEVRISKKKQNSQILLQIGSLISREIGNERGSVNLLISESGGKSLIHLKFSFWTPYLLSSIYLFSVWLALMWIVSLVFPQVWQLAFSYNNLMIFLITILIAFGVGQSVGQTKRRFTTELSLFLRTLKHQRTRQIAERP